MKFVKYSFAVFMVATLFSSYSLADSGAPVVEPASAVKDTTDDQSITLNNQTKIVATQKQEENPELAYQIDANYPQIVGENLSSTDQQFNRLVMDKVNQSIQQFKYYVKADHTHMLTLPEDIRHNTLHIDYDMNVVSPNNQPVISLRLNIEGIQAGRAHPYHTHQTLNYDLTNGKVLLLGDLFKQRSNYLRTIAKFCNQKLNSTLQDKWMIAEGAKADPKNFKNWNVESDGLLITFEEYQVAPYAYGPQEVEIPYAALKNILATNSLVMPCLKDSYSCILDN